MGEKQRAAQDRRLDQALQDTFPASDVPAASVPTTADRLPEGVIEVPGERDDRVPGKSDDNKQRMPEVGRRKRAVAKRETRGIDDEKRDRD